MTGLSSLIAIYFEPLIQSGLVIAHSKEQKTEKMNRIRGRRIYVLCTTLAVGAKGLIKQWNRA